MPSTPMRTASSPTAWTMRAASSRSGRRTACPAPSPASPPSKRTTARLSRLNRTGEPREDGAMQTAARTDESALVAALRAGDERAFMDLVTEYTPGMRRLALTFVRTGAVADEVVQDAWVGVLRGIDRFEGRSSLKTWIYRIVANIGRTRGAREARSAPFSAFEGDDGASVDPERFDGDGHWSKPIEPWQQVLDAEARRVIDDAIARLPEQQRQVIELR